MISISSIIMVIGSCAFCYAIGCFMGYKGMIRSKPMCDSCKHLIKKGGSSWKYTCDRRGIFTDTFDKAPTYCKDYERRNGDG